MGKNSTKLGELGVSFSGIHSTTWVKNNDGMGWNGMVWYGMVYQPGITALIFSNDHAMLTCDIFLSGLPEQKSITSSITVSRPSKVTGFTT